MCEYWTDSKRWSNPLLFLFYKWEGVHWNSVYSNKRTYLIKAKLAQFVHHWQSPHQVAKFFTGTDSYKENIRWPFAVLTKTAFTVRFKVKILVTSVISVHAFSASTTCLHSGNILFLRPYTNGTINIDLVFVGGKSGIFLKHKLIKKRNIYGIGRYPLTSSRLCYILKPISDATKRHQRTNHTIHRNSNYSPVSGIPQRGLISWHQRFWQRKGRARLLIF